MNKLTPRITKVQKLDDVENETETTKDIYLKPLTSNSLTPKAKIPKANRNWFYADEMAAIYNIPAPNLVNNVNVAVVSFGGGLYGSLSPTGVLTNGDCQTYWASIGILPQNMPTVVVLPINGARNLPNVNDSGATFENTLDVQQIGACCPSSKLTIVLYIVPNSLSNFTTIMNYILNVSTYKPFAISISWGAPEVYYPTSLLNSINTLFNSAIIKGINITAASGDNGSNNGVGGTGSYADFPAASPNVTSCGGTKLTCPNLIYDNQTIEIAWSSGGGALSGYFNSPSYQSSLNVARRSVPDIALNADPSTGVLYIINNNSYILGGTSIVSPIIAGYLTAIGANKFLNPILYTSPSNVFNDVLIGSNGAFTAKTGYDNCSGLGSIVGNLLANIITNIPTSPPTPPTPTVINVTSLSLNVSSLRIRRGQTYQLTATVLPTNATNKSIIWSTSNSRFATVSSSGLIRAISIGNTTITARTVDQNKIATVRLIIIR